MQELRIPRECYKYSTGSDQIASEGNTYFQVEGLNCVNEIQLIIKDALMPWDVYTDRETLFATNQVKSLFIETIKLLTQKQFILGTIYTFFDKRELQRFTDSFNKQAFRILSPYILKDRHLTKTSKELHLNIFTFMYHLGLTETSADKFAEIFVHLIEYDNAYRFRIMDVMDTMTKEEFNTPQQAISKLIGVILRRDWIGTSDKYLRILKLVRLALYLPKVRKAFDALVENMTIENLQTTDDDRYWMCLDGGYPFMGMTVGEREQYANKRGWSYPNKMI